MHQSTPGSSEAAEPPTTESTTLKRSAQHCKPLRRKECRDVMRQAATSGTPYRSDVRTLSRWGSEPRRSRARRGCARNGSVRVEADHEHDGAGVVDFEHPSDQVEKLDVSQGQLRREPRAARNDEGPDGHRAARRHTERVHVEELFEGEANARWCVPGLLAPRVPRTDHGTAWIVGNPAWRLVSARCRREAGARGAENGPPGCGVRHCLLPLLPGDGG